MLSAEARARALEVRARAERLSKILDTAVGIPGTRIRFGLDALIGLIPGIGDALGMLLGGWFLLEGARAGAPTSVLARMAANLGIDALVGVVPVFGDLFDVAFKANRRNARLLTEHLDRIEGHSKPQRRWTAYVFAVAVVALLLLALYGLWSLIVGLF